MAVRSKPFARWSSKWSVAATGGGVAGLAALALAGQGQTALALLAAGGAAGAALWGAGKLRLGGEESKIDARLQQVLGVLPSAVAVTNRRGKVLWRSEALLKLLAGSGTSKDLSRLGEGQPEAAAAIFRLIHAAGGGLALTETLAVPNVAGGAAVHLTVTPRLDRAWPRGIPRLAIRAGEGRGRKRGLGRYCEPAGAGAVDCQGFVGAGSEPPLRKALRQFSRWRAGLDAVPYQARQAVHPDLAQGFDREGR